METEFKEPTLVEDTISTIEQKYTKTNKTYLLVEFASGLRASAWDQQVLWPILKTAQTNNTRLQVWYTRNNMGYNNIQNLELMGAVQAPVTSASPGTSGQHFIKGVNGQTTPAKPPAPGGQQTPAAGMLTTSDRVGLCLATAMIAWGGTMVKNEAEYFVWLKKLEDHAEKGGILPGYSEPGPAYQDPEHGG